MTTGQRLYVKDLGFQMVNSIYRSPTSDALGLVGNQDTVRSKFVTFDVKTGNKVWETDTPFENPWGDQRPSTIRAGDKFYMYSTDGYVRAFELKTGKQIWKTHIGYT